MFPMLLKASHRLATDSTALIVWLVQILQLVIRPRPSPGLPACQPSDLLTTGTLSLTSLIATT